MDPLYVLSVFALLAVPVLQIRLHREIARTGAAHLSSIRNRNNLLLLIAGLAAVLVIRFDSPDSGTWIPAIVAASPAALSLFLWTMAVLKLWRMHV